MESEFELIDWIARRAGGQPPPGVLRSIGDDCALIRGGQGPLAIATDVLVEGVDFRRSWMSPAFLGRKSLAVNLSDLAAMGAEPLCCLLALSLPPDSDDEFARGLLGGFLENGRRYGCPLVGGDLSACDLVHVSVTVVGSFPNGDPIPRSGSQPGDAVLLTGRVGFSSAGLRLLKEGRFTGLDRIGRREELGGKVSDPFERGCLEAHLDPEPLLDVGRWLSRRGAAHSMIDVSDGLAADLLHLARAGGVAAELDARELQLLREASNERMEMDLILNGGEDYALLFSASPSQSATLRREWPTEFPPLRQIGTFMKGSPALFLRDPAGCRELQPKGFDHFR